MTRATHSKIPDSSCAGVTRTTPAPHRYAHKFRDPTNGNFYSTHDEAEAHEWAEWGLEYWGIEPVPKEPYWPYVVIIAGMSVIGYAIAWLLT